MINRYYFYTITLFFMSQVIHTIEPETTDKASKNARWNIEIYNKQNNPGWIKVDYYDKIMGGILIKPTKIPSYGKIRTTGDTSRQMRLRVWYAKPNILTETLRGNIDKILQGCKTRKPCDGTVFVALTEDGEVKPQTGKLFGFAGLTDSGLNNKNNLSPLNIGNTPQ